MIETTPEVNVLLHDDWEIYGDGSGDPYQLMFKPASKLLDICDKYGAKYTFNVEIGQQLNMLNSTENYWQDVAAKWESFIIDAIQRGHDAQLHFHPQWINAKLKGGEWYFGNTSWDTGQIDAAVLSSWIEKGKNYLEKLLKPVDKNYQVVAFRAGGWRCQPSEGLYKALSQSGILCDFSVRKGRWIEYADGSSVDFRDAVSRFEPWEVDPKNFANYKKGSGIYELPVYTEESSLPQALFLLKKSFRPWHYYKALFRAKDTSDVYSPRVKHRANNVEYCGSFGYMHYKHLLSYYKKVSSCNFSTNFSPYIIYNTHSKDFLDFNNFEKFISKLSEKDGVQFSTTRQYVEANFRS